MSLKPVEMQSSEKKVIPLIMTGKSGSQKFPARNPTANGSSLIMNQKDLVGKVGENDYAASNINTVNLLNQFQSSQIPVKQSIIADKNQVITRNQNPVTSLYKEEKDRKKRQQ